MGDLEKDIDAEIKRTKRSIQEIGNAGMAKTPIPSEESRVGLKMYSVKEVSSITGLSEDTIRRYVRDGSIKYWKPVSKKGRIRIPESELTKYNQ